MHVIRTSSSLSFNSNEGETLLDAAGKAGIFFLYSCRNGRCGSCKAKLISGECHSQHEELGLSQKELDDGWILTCVRTAVSDLNIEVEDLGKLSLPPVTTVPARISSIEKVSRDVLKVMLRIPPARSFNFYPGQYVEIIGFGGIRRSYSLANASADDKFLEFHIGEVPGGAMSNYWFHQAKVDDLLRINGPLGTFFLRNIAGLDLIFLATGTGIAPVKSMLAGLQALEQQDQPRSITVYWGRRTQSELYETLMCNFSEYRYVPVLSRANIEWNGVKGYVQEVYLAETPDQSNRVVYACGSDAMIHSAKRDLIEAGLPEHRFYSDAFVCSATN